MSGLKTADLKNANASESFEAALALALGCSRDDSRDCPNAESIAAYYESLLAKSEAALCERHLARCVKCQGQLAVMVRTDEAGLLKVSRSERDRYWIKIAGSAALVAVIALALLNRIGPRIARIGAVELRVPSLKADGQSTARGPSTAANVAQPLGANLASSNRPAEGAQSAPSDLTPTLSQLEPSEQVASAIGGSLSDSAVGFELSSPSQSAFWRIGADGSISWSHDGEKWEMQHQGPPAQLRVGGASSAFTCWLGGRHGAILKSIDGTSWKNVASPTEADIIAMDVRSAYAATITTVSGSRYKTVDGGRSWLPLGRKIHRRTNLGSTSSGDGPS